MPVVFGTVEDWDHDYIIVCTVGISVNCIAECKYAFIVAESFLVCHFSREGVITVGPHCRFLHLYSFDMIAVPKCFGNVIFI